VNNLRDSEQKWTAYRDAACNAERGLWGKGSGAPGGLVRLYDQGD